MLAEKCMLICHNSLQKKTTHRRLISSREFFIKSMGFLTINHISYVEETLSKLANTQHTDGSFPRYITFGNVSMNLKSFIPKSKAAKLEANIETNAFYIIGVHTLEQINCELIQHIPIVKAVKFLYNNSRLHSPFHAILLITAFNAYKDLTSSIHFDLDIRLIDLKIQQLERYTMDNYWNGHYLKTPQGGFCEKTNAFAILFHFTKASSVICSWMKLSPVTNIVNRLLFLIAIIHHGDRTYIDTIEKELTTIERTIISSMHVKTTIASLYVTCRIALEKTKTT